jgi:beta-glucosidase
VSVEVTNTGKRPGKQVVQVYASRLDSMIERPVRWLVGFAPVSVAAGHTRTVSVEIPPRAFADWDDGWHYEPGDYTLHVSTSVDDGSAVQLTVDLPA